jgi:heme oxygenase
MSLKDLTWDKHKIAERQGFVKVLLSGKINPKFYSAYLQNVMACYSMLESCANTHGLLDGLDDIRRTARIQEDLDELEHTKDNSIFVPVVNEYLDHILRLSWNNPQQLMAHVYVRHMGDLSGGQMIARKVPGSGHSYQFDNVDLLKEKIRERLTDDLADEANLGFDFSIALFQQVMELDIPKYIDD